MVIKLLVSFRSELLSENLLSSYLVSAIINLADCVVWWLAILVAEVLSLNLFSGKINVLTGGGGGCGPYLSYERYGLLR
jgi:hypothetical protein